MSIASTFFAGAASLPLEPPLGLPMVGFVRQPSTSRGYGYQLEVGALALERDGTRVVLCGVDIIGITTPEIEELIGRVSEVTGAAREGILLNWSHTHLAPAGGRMNGDLLGEIEPSLRASVDAFSRVVQDTIVAVCRMAIDRLEPAWVVWGQGESTLAVNRRERTADGSNGGTILGWNPDELVDSQVTVLQARRPDESPIATLVGFGCHPVTTGHDMLIYSADFPGPMRSLIRSVSGGECVFFQGAGGNVLPMFAFTDTEEEAERVGTRLALTALEAVADRFTRPVAVVTEEDGSVTPVARYRRRFLDVDPPALSAISKQVTIPLMSHPRLDDVEALHQEYTSALDAARRRGDPGAVKVAYYHAEWARKIAGQLRAGSAPTEIRAPVHAVRIGDGVIVTGPGETFTEYGIAVKERAPGSPTLYAGYTNESIGYLPTAAEYRFGGYEAGYGYKTVGLPSLFDPSVERICVEAGVRLAEQLFPGIPVWDASRGWTASGNPPELEAAQLEHPRTPRLSAQP